MKATLQFRVSSIRPCAARYLDHLAEAGIVEKQQAGRNNYCVNVALVRLFINEAGGR